MSYLALARKWRPRTFQELLGQEQLTTALTHSLDQNRVHHAYLFTGTRGVGKTSVARLLAKSLNCIQGVSSTPCLQCDACLSIEQGRFVDLIEIDAASKTRVEDTRDVLDNVQYAPTVGRYKIYLIDEVHMLSQHSFNALLKTLEEPPSHVKFLLATTDPQKIPVTVLSRCLQFNLRHVDDVVISRHLQYVLQKESFSFEPEAVELLVKASSGSMRDALSLLDQAIATCGDALRAQPIRELLGFTQQDYAKEILVALASNQPIQLLHISQQVLQTGGHFLYVLDELLNDLHQIAMYQVLGEQASPLLKLDDALLTLSQRFSKETVQLMYQIALKSKDDIHSAPSLFVGFEMTLLRMHAFLPVEEQPLVLSALPSPAHHSTPSSCHAASSLPITESVEAARDEGISVPANAASVSTDADKIIWRDLVAKLNVRGLTRTAADNAELITFKDDEILLSVEKKHESLFTKPVTARLEEALTTHFQRPLRLKVTFSIEAVLSPALQQKKQNALEQQEANAMLNEDAFFQKLQATFSGEVVSDSLTLKTPEFEE